MAIRILLSDPKKRTQYDVGLYDPHEEENEEKVYGLEELQSMFMEMAKGFEYPSMNGEGPSVVEESGGSWGLRGTVLDGSGSLRDGFVGSVGSVRVLGVDVGGSRELEWNYVVVLGERLGLVGLLGLWRLGSTGDVAEGMGANVVVVPVSVVGTRVLVVVWTVIAVSKSFSAGVLSSATVMNWISGIGTLS
ncbi:unnamed protein product [Lupinus luteus]|uniref:Uncharacterized protein n=1 Tax=Lupinus luteus TaxID=3873 RepID=A0AAV1Y1S1_LUPLU